MFSLGIILALIQAVGTLFLPKTPRFLLMSDKNELAFKTLQKIRGHGIDVESEFNEMKSAILEEQGYHWFVVNYPIQPYTKIDIKMFHSICTSQVAYLFVEHPNYLNLPPMVNSRLKNLTFNRMRPKSYHCNKHPKQPF